MAAFSLMFLSLFLLSGYTAEEMQLKSAGVQCSEVSPCPTGYSCNMFPGEAKGICVRPVRRARRDAEEEEGFYDGFEEDESDEHDDDFDSDEEDEELGFENDDSKFEQDDEEGFGMDEDEDEDNHEGFGTNEDKDEDHHQGFGMEDEDDDEGYGMNEDKDDEDDHQGFGMEDEDHHKGFGMEDEDDHKGFGTNEDEDKEHEKEYDDDDEDEKTDNKGFDFNSNGDNVYVKRLEKQLERNQRKHSMKKEENKEELYGKDERYKSSVSYDDLPVHDVYDTNYHENEGDDEDDDVPDYLDETIYPELEKEKERERQRRAEENHVPEGAAKNEKQDAKNPDAVSDQLPPVAHQEEVPHPNPSVVNTPIDSPASDTKPKDSRQNPYPSKQSDLVPQAPTLDSSKTVERPKSLKPSGRPLTPEEIEVLRGHLKQLRHPTGNNANYRHFSPDTHRAFERIFFHTIRTQIEQIVGQGKLLNQPWFHAALAKYIDGEYNMLDLFVLVAQVTSRDDYQLYSGSGEPSRPVPAEFQKEEPTNVEMPQPRLKRSQHHHSYPAKYVSHSKSDSKLDSKQHMMNRLDGKERQTQAFNDLESFDDVPEKVVKSDSVKMVYVMKNEPKDDKMDEDNWEMDKNGELYGHKSEDIFDDVPEKMDKSDSDKMDDVMKNESKDDKMDEDNWEMDKNGELYRHKSEDIFDDDPEKMESDSDKMDDVMKNESKDDKMDEDNWEMDKNGELYGHKSEDIFDDDPEIMESDSDKMDDVMKNEPKDDKMDEDNWEMDKNGELYGHKSEDIFDDVPEKMDKSDSDKMDDVMKDEPMDDGMDKDNWEMHKNGDDVSEKMDKSDSDKMDDVMKDEPMDDEMDENNWEMYKNGEMDKDDFEEMDKDNEKMTKERMENDFVDGEMKQESDTEDGDMVSDIKRSVSSAKASKSVQRQDSVVFQKIKKSLNHKKSASRDSSNTRQTLPDLKSSHQLSPRDLEVVRHSLREGVDSKGKPMSLEEHKIMEKELIQKIQAKIELQVGVVGALQDQAWFLEGVARYIKGLVSLNNLIAVAVRKIGSKSISHPPEAVQSSGTHSQNKETGQSAQSAEPANHPQSAQPASHSQHKKAAKAPHSQDKKSAQSSRTPGKKTSSREKREMESMPEMELMPDRCGKLPPNVANRIQKAIDDAKKVISKAKQKLNAIEVAQKVVDEEEKEGAELEKAERILNKAREREREVLEAARSMRDTAKHMKSGARSSKNAEKMLDKMDMEMKEAAKSAEEALKAVAKLIGKAENMKAVIKVLKGRHESKKKKGKKGKEKDTIIDTDSDKDQVSIPALQSAMDTAKNKLDKIMEEAMTALSALQKPEDDSSRAKRFTDLHPNFQKVAIVSHLLELDLKEWAELMKRINIKLPGFSYEEISPKLSQNPTKYNTTTIQTDQENSTSSNSSSRTSRAAYIRHESSHKHKTVSVKPSKNILRAHEQEKLRRKQLMTMHNMKSSSGRKHHRHRAHKQPLPIPQHLKSLIQHHSSTTPHHKKAKSPYHTRQLVQEDPEQITELGEDQDVEESPCMTKKGEKLHHGEKIQIDCNTCQCLYGKFECTQVDCTMADPNVQETGLIKTRRDTAGKNDVVNDPCKRCEEKKNEAVCGNNRKTYNSLCHAVNCADLQVEDVREGPCETKDPCKDNTCKKKKEICTEAPGGPCLALYNSKNQKVKCARYICIPKMDCPTEKSKSAVCGHNGKTYQSLCHLQKAGKKLAYTGSCRPEECTGLVCGSDGVTYNSPCHAQARSVRIDYYGKCFAEDTDKDLGNCEDVRNAGRCSKLSCKDAVIPEGSCCPVCGAAVSIRPDSKGLADIEEGNHLLVMQNFIFKLLPDTIQQSCRLSASLTDKGDITVVLEALSDERISRCNKAAKDLVDLVNKPPKKLQETSIITKLCGAAQSRPIAKDVMKNMSPALKNKTPAEPDATIFNDTSGYTSGAASSSMKALTVLVVTVSVTVSLSIAMSMMPY